MADQTVAGQAVGRHPGADPANVGRWLADRLGDPAWTDCSLDMIGVGRSNLTYRVSSAAGTVVLRRPPVGEVAATAHDMGRERTVMAALRDTAVPVPRVLAHSDGGPPVDAPCYVMDMIEGVVPLETLPAGWADAPADRARAGAALVDVLVALHAVDPDAAGLSSFGRPDGFMSRQVRRWGSQWEAARTSGLDSVDQATEDSLTALSGRLSGALPTTQRNTIVHGDYRIDNCVFDASDPGSVLAVLDWELSALGDPLADLGLMLVYWCHADEHPIWRAAQRIPTPTRLPGFPTRPEIAAAYGSRSGLDLEPLAWYVAFGAFKLAVVLAGILARVSAGSVPAEMADGLDGAVDPLVVLGHHVLDEGID